MNLVYYGGLNNHNPNGFQTSYFYRNQETVKKLIADGKRVCFVTLAKPDGYLDKHILPQFGDTVDVIQHSTLVVDWNIYDLIFLCGGDTPQLKTGMLRLGFSFQKLKESVTLFGDSAGAMLMARYFYVPDSNRVVTSFEEGLRPEIPFVVLVHVNNPKYASDELIKSVENFAREKQLGVLKLAENETKLWDPNQKAFVSCHFDSLFE